MKNKKYDATYTRCIPIHNFKTQTLLSIFHVIKYGKYNTKIKVLFG